VLFTSEFHRGVTLDRRRRKELPPVFGSGDAFSLAPRPDDFGAFARAAPALKIVLKQRLGVLLRDRPG
jgi:hypothetical protein